MKNFSKKLRNLWPLSIIKFLIVVCIVLAFGDAYITIVSINSFPNVISEGMPPWSWLVPIFGVNIVIPFAYIAKLLAIWLGWWCIKNYSTKFKWIPWAMLLIFTKSIAISIYALINNATVLYDTISLLRRGIL